MSAAALEAVAGLGLRGDCHAHPLSPRQVLLADAAVYRRLGLAPATLRENVTLDADLRAWPSGSVVALGRDVRLRVMFRCEPCAKLNVHRPGLLRAVGEGRGVLARVVRGGIVRVGDSVALAPAVLPPWSDVWQERVLRVVRAVPDGHVVEFTQLARLAGVPRAYCRAFPRVLGALGEGTARAVPAGGAATRPRWTGESLFADEARPASRVGAQLLQHGEHLEHLEHRAAATPGARPPTHSDRFHDMAHTAMAHRGETSPETAHQVQKAVEGVLQNGAVRSALIEHGEATLLVTKGRRLGGDLEPAEPPAEYPTVRSSLRDDADSWLR